MFVLTWKFPFKVSPPYSWSAAGRQCPNTCRSSSSAWFTVPDNYYLVNVKVMVSLFGRINVLSCLQSHLPQFWLLHWNKVRVSLDADSLCSGQDFPQTELLLWTIFWTKEMFRKMGAQRYTIQHDEILTAVYSAWDAKSEGWIFSFFFFFFCCIFFLI